MSDSVSKFIGSNGYDTGLLTMSKDGEIPGCRMQDANAVVDFVRRLWQNDEKRSWKRSRVDGLVGGNPPYRTSALKSAGRADACNVNWGTARMYLESGMGAFYDLSTEAPAMFEIITSHGNDEEIEKWSREMSNNADLVVGADPLWDFEEQNSQEQMVSHGRGPLFFETPFAVLPVAVHDGDLKVPERTRGDSAYWDASSIDRDYYPPQLYRFIEDVDAARAVGWNVGYTRKCIANATTEKQENGQYYAWEYYQQEIKNNSLSYYDDTLVSKLAHVFWKEFNGRVTHAIVERENTAESSAEYLMISVGKYASFAEVIHPMYFDRGQGGFHHSITGLGVKMYGAMEHENRTICNLMDAANAPKVLFKPSSAEVRQKMTLAVLGPFGVVPSGWDVMQSPIQGGISEGLAMFRTTSELMRSNLSNYRQSVAMKQEGNPITARQVMHDASTQSSLNKTTYNRYYKQRDQLLAEIVARLCNLNSPDERAKRYQKMCTDAGVPEECFGRIASVKAVRTIGQGNIFMRKASIDSLQAVVPMFSEDGRRNWLNDKIAVEAGSGAVNRYNPAKNEKKLPSEQQFNALEGITMMKVGVPPIVTASQNPVIFAGTYLKAATDSLNSLKQGGNPGQVLQFLMLAGPAIMAHLQRFQHDPTRQVVFKAMFEQWQRIAAMTDKLKKHMQQMQKQQQQQRQKTAKVMSDQEIKERKAQGDERRKNLKLRAQLQRDSVSTRQRLAIADATAASDIHRKNMQSYLE